MTMPSFFKQKTALIPSNINNFRSAIKDFDNRLKTVRKMNTEDLGDGYSGLNPNKSRYPLNRATRILSYLQKIEINLLNNNSDSLNEDDVSNLIKIANYSRHFILDYYPVNLKTPKRFSDFNFSFNINEYKEAADAINMKKGEPFKRLSGHVLQIVGIFLVLSLSITICNPALALPLGILAAVGAACFGVGTYLSRNNTYYGLTNDVNKTLNSPTCDKTKHEDPEQDSFIKLMVPNFCC